MGTLHVAVAEGYRQLVEPLKTVSVHGEARFQFHFFSDRDLIAYVAGRDFHVFLPQSALSLLSLEDEWKKRRDHPEAEIVQSESPVAVTPVVFFLRPELASELDVWNQPLSWRSLAEIAGERAIRIRRATSRSTDGLAISVAQRLAMGDDDRIAAIEQRVEEYGPDDREVLHRAFAEDHWAADLVIAQERSVIAEVNRSPHLRGVIAYPHDGALGIPTVLARANWGGEEIGESYAELAHRLSQCSDHDLARSGLHRQVESLAGTESVSLIAAAQSQTSPQIRWAAHAGATPIVLPSRRAVRGIRQLAKTTQRAVDVCLVFDSSGSMGQEDRFPAALRGVDAFLELVDAPASRVSLVRIRDGADLLVPLTPRTQFRYDANQLAPSGQTALLDGVYTGVQVLQSSGASDHLLAIVGFTDGLENASATSQSQMESLLRQDGRIRFYGIAYGVGADVASLSGLASASGGLVVGGGASEIKSLYERLSTFV